MARRFGRAVAIAIALFAPLAAAQLWPGTEAPFNCSAFPNPIQIGLPDGDPLPYKLAELDLGTGQYNLICDYPAAQGGINGLALMEFPGTDDVYSFICRSGTKTLVRFDCSGSTVIPGTLTSQGDGGTGPTCNAATFIGDTYHYTQALKNNNNQIYQVTGLSGASPTFHDASVAKFKVSDAILKAPINDITNLEEFAGGAFQNLIDDGVVGAAYLVGLSDNKGTGPELFIARIVGGQTFPESYAILYTAWSNVDWSGRPAGSTPPTPANGIITGPMGGAYTYDDGVNPPSIFFSSNHGFGLFEVVIPTGGIEVPPACWNTGTTPGDVATHIACVAAEVGTDFEFDLRWVAQSAVTDNNDGSACPGVPKPIFPTLAPTGSFAPTGEPTAQPTAPPTTLEPTPRPTTLPTPALILEPTYEPTTLEPTAGPTTLEPTPGPTSLEPTMPPSMDPTAQPTVNPTYGPTAQPTEPPTADPTAKPTADPTATPTAKPTAAPSAGPSAAPSAPPTVPPSAGPTATAGPSVSPSYAPTVTGTTDAPTVGSYAPTTETYVPTPVPTAVPTPLSTTRRKLRGQPEQAELIIE